MITKKKFDIDQSSHIYCHLRDEVQKNILETRKAMSTAIEEKKHTLYFAIGRLLHDCKTALSCRLPKDLHAALAQDVKDLVPWLGMEKDLAADLKHMEALYNKFMEIEFRPESTLPHEYRKMVADFVDGHRNTKAEQGPYQR